MKLPNDDVTTTATATTTSKPVFLTKAQREQLAFQRRQEQVADIKRHQDELLFLNRPSDPKPSSDRDRDRDRDGDRDGHRHRDRDRDRERRNREREREEESKARERARLEKVAEREREKKLESIKEQYLGSKKPKKRVIIPLGLQQRDVIGIAMLSYINWLPRMNVDNEAEGPYADLAQQIEDETVKFAKSLGFRVVYRVTTLHGEKSQRSRGRLVSKGSGPRDTMFLLQLMLLDVMWLMSSTMVVQGRRVLLQHS